MSTPCKIGLITPNGEIHHIHCELNGFLGGVHGAGYILHNYYQELSKIEELLGLGNLKCLGINPIGVTYSQNWMMTAEICERSHIPIPARSLNETSFNLSLASNREFSERGFVYLYQNEVWFVKKPNSDLYFPLSETLLLRDRTRRPQAPL